MVYSAQGVIGNGGYYYFFEHDWPNDPPYSKFIDAYLEIGCSSQSNDLARVVSTFPFDNPHLNKNARNKYMDENYDEKKYEVKDWGDALCGDDEVWEKLKAYYLKKYRWFFLFNKSLVPTPKNRAAPSSTLSNLR